MRDNCMCRMFILAYRGPVRPKGGGAVEVADRGISKNRTTPDDGARERVPVVWRTLSGDLKRRSLIEETWEYILSIIADSW